MEGLFIARILEELGALLPARNLGWVFPDEATAALLIEPREGRPRNVVFSYRPPAPAVFVNSERLSGEPLTSFQRSLQARARGALFAAGQIKLDRVALLSFSDAEG
ncbi:MAG TPA: hypothetical protein VNT60_01360, partial [Deinococcales bacterium]|nr:hypothetical protein [Deinococcales bacterium]